MNNDCVEFRRGLADSSGSSDERLCSHIEQCADCAAFLDERITGAPHELEHASWEDAPGSLTDKISSDIISVHGSSAWQAFISGLAGLALAAAVLLFFIRGGPLTSPHAASPLLEQFSFLNPADDSISEFSFMDDAEETLFVTDETDHVSYKWTFLETGSHFTFIENDKEALWEDLSNG